MEDTPDLEDISDLVFYTNRALLGEIRAHMRAVAVEYTKSNKTFCLYLYYDQDPTQDELDYDVAGTILAEISSNFPQEVKWVDEIIVLPYPGKIPDKGVCVFHRYESLQES